ncbi:hypothetical protein AYI70_g4911 [Smittium culicis]|uniref:Uncharacterized protein n=1 Tax=Smittium culicis TaxID=133412 RepID=A0A1R1XWU7_9FUNG|nr:hypothetical protein AYI70_g4911 [Smittium culicis]
MEDDKMERLRKRRQERILKAKGDRLKQIFVSYEQMGADAEQTPNSPSAPASASEVKTTTATDAVDLSHLVAEISGTLLPTDSTDSAVPRFNRSFDAPTSRKSRSLRDIVADDEARDKLDASLMGSAIPTNSRIPALTPTSAILNGSNAEQLSSDNIAYHPQLVRKFNLNLAMAEIAHYTSLFVLFITTIFLSTRSDFTVHGSNISLSTIAAFIRSGPSDTLSGNDFTKYPLIYLFIFQLCYSLYSINASPRPNSSLISPSNLLSLASNTTTNFCLFIFFAYSFSIIF